MSSNVLSALQGVRFIAQHIRDADKDNEVTEFRKGKRENKTICKLFRNKSFTIA